MGPSFACNVGETQFHQCPIIPPSYLWITYWYFKHREYYNKKLFDQTLIQVVNKQFYNFKYSCVKAIAVYFSLHAKGTVFEM